MISQELKKDNLKDARANGIPIVHSGEVLGNLVPVGPWIFGEIDLIRQIADWRNAALRMFLTQAESTPASTTAYLKSRAVDQDSRLLFMIEVDGSFLGHLGLANISEKEAELDNLMRGTAGGPANLIEESLRTLTRWAFSELGVVTLYLRLLSHNFMARALHQGLGFEVVERRSLRSEETADGTALVECEAEEATVRITCDVMSMDRGFFLAQENS